jgi:hypothetical protein
VPAIYQQLFSAVDPTNSGETSVNSLSRVLSTSSLPATTIDKVRHTLPLLILIFPALLSLPSSPPSRNRYVAVIVVIYDSRSLTPLSLRHPPWSMTPTTMPTPAVAASSVVVSSPLYGPFPFPHFRATLPYLDPFPTRSSLCAGPCEPPNSPTTLAASLRGEEAQTGRWQEGRRPHRLEDSGGGTLTGGETPHQLY